jgi:tetratricopeptide (TPR) repeat protein
MKSQFASVGAAMSSAYTKTKTAITAPFSSASNTIDVDAKDSDAPAKSLSIAPEVLVAQGNYFESQGNYAKAIDSYSRALEAEPTNPTALMSTARLYDKQNDSAKSVEFYRKAIAAAPSNADAHSELGGLLARAGDLKAANTELQQAVQLQPQNRTYRSSLAGVLLDSGNSDAALQQLHEAESPAMAQYQMAYLHFNRKNIPATQQHLQEALKIDPNLKPARDLLASMGGAQNVNQMVQQGQQFGQQAMGIYQQAGSIANNVSQLVGTPNTQTLAAPGPMTSLPPSLPPQTALAPVTSNVAPIVSPTATGPYSPIPPLPPTAGSTVLR